MEEILNTILKEIRELNVKVDSLLARQGQKKSLTGIVERKPEDDFVEYVKQISNKHKQFPGLNMLTLENLQKYKEGTLSLESLMASIGSLYSKRNSFYNFLKDLKIVSAGKYDFVKTKGDEDNAEYN